MLRQFLHPVVSRFVSDSTGGIAILSSLCMLLIMAIVGGAIDYGRSYSSHTRLQQAVDAATLAVAVAYMNDAAHSPDAAVNKGDALFKTLVDMSGTSFTASIDQTAQTAKSLAQVKLDTYFLGVVGIPTITITATAEATALQSIAKGTGDNQIELSLMLDTTGSMGSSDGNGKSKIDALKKAASDLVDVLIPDANKPLVRIALAPFAPTVNLGDDYVAQATGQPLLGTTCAATETVCSGSTCTKQCLRETTSFLRRCVTERRGPAEFTDERPGPGSYIPVVVPRGSSGDYASSLANARDCTPGQPIVPLTSNKGSLKSTIAQFKASGSTAGSLGTAWAWYLLSPEWADIFSGDSAPKAYGTKNVKKIAVLMTDGTFNTENGTSFADGGSDAQRISANAVTLCAGMKAKGIEVYTVGFKLDNDLARRTLSQCATDAAHAFFAEDGEQLSLAFKEVAYRAIPLHLIR